jgi:hypothetical protein
MTLARNRDVKSANTGSELVPPGATRRAFDREDNGGTTPPTPLGDRHAQGTPAGGTSVGGLGGTNIAEGSPQNANLEEAMAGDEEDHWDDNDQPPYAGHAGGAVGGSPAEGRSSGGNVHGGLAPGGVHRGDSTVGSNPPRRRKKQ